MSKFTTVGQTWSEDGSEFGYGGVWGICYPSLWLHCHRLTARLRSLVVMIVDNTYVLRWPLFICNLSYGPPVVFGKLQWFDWQRLRLCSRTFKWGCHVTWRQCFDWRKNLFAKSDWMNADHAMRSAWIIIVAHAQYAILHAIVGRLGHSGLKIGRRWSQGRWERRW